MDDQITLSVVNPELSQGELVFLRAEFSQNDQDTQKVYDEIMRHKKHKKRVETTQPVQKDSIYAYSRKDSNLEQLVGLDDSTGASHPESFVATRKSSA